MLVWGVVILGVVLRVLQYAADSSLWMDEIGLARNLLDRSLWDLLTNPLAYDQLAPKGFLLVEKLVVFAFGEGGYALRLFPLICSLAALVLFPFIARRVLGGFAVIVSVALFAAAGPFVNYSSRVKQYSTDVAVSLMLLWLALDLESRTVSTRRAFAVGLAGAIAVCFSQTAALLLVGFGAALVLLAWRTPGAARTQRLRALRPVLALWSASAVMGVLVGYVSMTPATRAYMKRFWSHGFMPFPPTEVIQRLWPLDRLRLLFGPERSEASLAYPFPELYVVLIILGFWVLWRRQNSIAVLLLAPVGVTLAAAVVRQYPFEDRLILFLLPSFLLAIAASIEWIRQWVSSFSRTPGVLAIILLTGGALYPTAKTPPPYVIHDVDSVLSHLSARRSPGDGVYVYYGAGPAVTFYSAKHGFQEREYTMGGCHRGETRRYLEELDPFRGRPRLWIVLANARPSRDERIDILRYLDTIGQQRHSFSVQSRLVGSPPPPAEVFLYDLSDPDRLGTATARMFPIGRPDNRSCGEGPESSVDAHAARDRMAAGARTR